MSKFTVLFDACVLYPAPLRDLLVQLATTELFRAKWTEEIHEEWVSSVLEKRQDLSRDQLERTKYLMNAAVLDCVVEGYEYIIPTLSLPDKDDRHVLAAAIHGKCDAIVTFNKKDFPVSEISKYNIEIIHPDDFVSYQFDLDKAASLNSVQACRKRLSSPSVNADNYLETLLRQSLTKTVSVLRPYSKII
ncbi:PIN domain-containing protein [Thalassobaculum sp.]|uniref:PIN domain-containing protein n=1 Tax=Thalassobaculum sp. TaxID=2022740 RepID=UPI003B5AA578